MPRFDDDLPLGEVDFRQFARTIARQADAVKKAKSADGALLRTRAVAVGADAGSQEDKARLDQLIAVGIEAAHKIAAAPGAVLNDDERLGYEAVVRLAERPALVIRDDSFPQPPERWRRLEEPFRDAIEAAILSAGRIDAAIGESRDMVGTGFVVSSDLIMTNTHVVEEFADPAPDFTSWEIRAGAEPTIDFKAEHESPKRKAFRIKEIVTAFDRNDTADRLNSLDLALLRVEPMSFDPPGARLPPALRLASHEPAAAAGGAVEAPAKDLYIVGYPWTDNEGITPPAVLLKIFGEIRKKKRLQPGEYGANFPLHLTFSHDVSTLGGNSGSFVIDLSSGLIIGLHFRGKYRQANYALQLWQLQDVPGIKGKGLNFSE